jgi:cation:H+ antiporter
MPLALTLLVAGFSALTLAADRFVLSAARLSRLFGVSPVLIGALVIGLGTSAPEMLVSGLAAGRGQIDLAVGNVVGSNTANLTLVLGSTAFVTPIVSRLETVRREGALMFMAMLIAIALLWDLQIGRLEAAGLVVGMGVSVVLLTRWAGLDAAAGIEPVRGEDTLDDREISVSREAAIGFLALVLTLIGAELLVRGATRLSEELGISTAFVGLVIVSVGTSLPELATALAAARRGETDLVLGNVVGSNLFNTFAVLGVAGLAGPGEVVGEFHGAMTYMIVVAGLAGVFILTGRRLVLVRWEGTLLLAMFLGFVGLSA